MALDLFSSFDDHGKPVTLPFLLLWMMPMTLSLICRRRTLCLNTMDAPQILTLHTAHGLLVRTKLSTIEGVYPMIISLIACISLINISGLLPYTLGFTTHLWLNFMVATPFWLVACYMSIMSVFNSFLEHFMPLGSPTFLAPVLGVIEGVSTLVRPFTLAVRLSANLSTGHILFALLGGASISMGTNLETFLNMLGFGYMTFEVSICAVQAYIFGLLPTLYLSEIPSPYLNYKNHMWSLQDY